MPDIQYPTYLQEADRAELNDLIASINEATAAIEISANIQLAINWLYQKKVAIATKQDLPVLADGKFPHNAFVQEKWDSFLVQLSESSDNDAKFLAFTALRKAIEQALLALYPEKSDEEKAELLCTDNLMAFGTAFLASRGLSSRQEHAFAALLKAMPSDADSAEQFFAIQYLGILIHTSTEKLKCCEALAKAGANKYELVKRADETLFMDDKEALLFKLQIYLALLPHYVGPWGVKLSRLDEFRSSYLFSINNSRDSSHEKYCKILECYQMVWLSAIPLEYLAKTLSEVQMIYLREDCYEAFAKAVFSIKHAGTEAAKSNLIKAVTDQIWQSGASLQQKTMWLQAVARTDESQIMRGYLRDRLESIPSKELIKAASPKKASHSVALAHFSVRVEFRPAGLMAPSSKPSP